MEIQSVYNPSSLSLTNLVRARYSNGRIAVPVQRNQLVFSHLKHVSGVPAVHRDSGCSITLLRRLDNLIDSLIGIKGDRAYAKDVSGLSNDQINSLIQRYEADLHNSIIKAPSSLAVQVQGILVDTFA